MRSEFSCTQREGQKCVRRGEETVVLAGPLRSAGNEVKKKALPNCSGSWMKRRGSGANFALLASSLDHDQGCIRWKDINNKPFF